jgi:divalent metal cation (Fe/Co/Zn/Cd) transporter
MHGFYNTWMVGSNFGFGPSPLGIAMLLIIVAWSLVWKGLALWKSAREGSNIWFVVMLIVNTVGILEILYLFVFSNKKKPAAITTEEKK